VGAVGEAGACAAGTAQRRSLVADLKAIAGVVQPESLAVAPEEATSVGAAGLGSLAVVQQEASIVEAALPENLVAGLEEAWFAAGAAVGETTEARTARTRQPSRSHCSAVADVAGA
jgi:hypothetical protein